MGRDQARSRQHRLTAVFNTLRFQVIAIMLLCYLIPVLLLGIFTHTVLLHGLQQKTEAALSSSVEHAWTLTTQNIEHAIQLAREAIYDGELTDTYNQWTSNHLSDAEYLRGSRSYLDRKYSRDSLFTFAGYFPVGRPELLMYTRSGNTEALSFLQEAQAEILRLGESLDTQNRFVAYKGQLYLIRNLMNLRMERYGMLILGVDQAALFAPVESLCDAWNADAQIQLDDYGATDIPWDSYSPGLSDNEDSEFIHYMQAADSDDYTLYLRLSLNRRELYSEMYTFRRLVLVIYLMLIPILLLLAFYLRKRIVKPVTLLSDAARRIEGGELGVTVPMHGGDELGNLGVAFSNMSRRIEELIDKTYKEEIELKSAQIQALQSRINPHFINNALEDINWQARMDGSETISSMVTSLSVLLNATMARKGRRMVSLRDEMEVADAYIYFVQQRFGTDITVERDIEEKALGSIVPLLTVQPVLENAVEHGIAPAGGGKIALSARTVGDCLLLTILNSGHGLQAEDREKIDHALHGQASTGDHLGLANIASRLRLIYGERASIQVSSNPDNETVVQISIPQDEE